MTGTNILTAIFSEPKSQAVYFLSQENISRIDIINYTTQGIIKPCHETRFIPDHHQMSEGTGMQETTVDENLIDLYTINYARAWSRRVDPIIGRQEELMRYI